MESKYSPMPEIISLQLRALFKRYKVIVSKDTGCTDKSHSHLTNVK